MPRTSRTEQELAYLRSAWEEIEDLANESDYKVVIELIPTMSRGVWAIVVNGQSIELDEHGLSQNSCRTMHRFPNGRNVTFAGELWALLRRYKKEVEELIDSNRRALGK